jgi:ParB family chromosome partitioning protein
MITAAVRLPGIANNIVMRRPGELKPFKRNARQHSEKQVAKIAAAIEEFGFTVPILIDDDLEIIAGHGRQLGALKLGLEQVPTIDGSWMTPAQRRAYRITDNKLPLDATWDDQLLAVELSDLGAEGFDLGLTGFSVSELRGLGIGNMVPGDAPNESVPGSWAVVIECKDEADQVELVREMLAQGRVVKGAIG